MTSQLFNLNDIGTVVEIPGGTCLLAYRGSIAHGMYCPPDDPASIDDVDLMGVVIGSEECYYGLREWGSRGTKEVKQGRYDVVFYEIRKMVSLLLQGNPNVLGLLWTKTEHRLYSNEFGDELIRNRNMFVGKHVYNAFAGYAHAQMEKMETRDPVELRQYLAVTAELKCRGQHPNQKGKIFDEPKRSDPIARDIEMWATDKLLARLRHYQKKGENIGYMGEKRKHLVLEHGYDTKNAAHLIRLLRMAKEFMATGELEVYRHDAEELLEIKRGEWALLKIKEHAASLFQEVREARDKSILPEWPDRIGAEDLLMRLVKSGLGKAA